MANLGRVIQKISFDGHIECYYTPDDFPKDKKLPGMHIGKERLVCDKDNYPVIFTDIINEGEVMRTLHGLGKCYGTNHYRNVVSLYADW